MTNEKIIRMSEVEQGIKELKAKIAEHEREENQRNYNFYVKGAELYKELNRLKVNQLMGKRILEEYDGE